MSDSIHKHMQNLRLGNKKPGLLIEFIVVGGGIAGFACAYALARSGHGVRVLEEHSGLHQRPGGIRVPPNLTSILWEWGLHEKLATALKCRKTQFRSFRTGKLVGILEWQDDIIREAGAEFLLMHYDDLHQALYELAVSAGAHVTFDTPVREVYFDKEKGQPIVILPDGAELAADVVVGADGYHSAVRRAITPEADAGIDTHHSWYTVTVPTSEMQNDPELRRMAEESEWPIWMGDSCNAYGYPIRDFNEYSIHVHWPDGKLREQIPIEEGRDVLVPTSIIDFGDFESSIPKLFNLAPRALRSKCVQREIAEDWVDESGRIVIVGGAAHPLLPCATNGPGLDVEDAAVLGTLMAHLSSKEQIPQLLDAFQDIRQDRCIKVLRSEVRNVGLAMLPPGEASDMRDVGMGLSLVAKGTNWDDARLRQQWEQIGGIFGYNAHEAAEDWWVKWGALGTVEETVHEPFELLYEVTSVAHSGA